MLLLHRITVDGWTDHEEIPWSRNPLFIGNAFATPTPFSSIMERETMLTSRNPLFIGNAFATNGEPEDRMGWIVCRNPLFIGNAFATG